MKSDAEILSELQPIFDDIFGDESVTLTPETTSDDVATWDSVAHVSLIVGVEKQFDIMFDFASEAAKAKIRGLTAHKLFGFR